jgi:hypothetical protein
MAEIVEEVLETPTESTVAVEEYTPPTPTVATTTSVDPVTTADVYSADNIESAVTSPTTAPDLSDPYGLYDQFMNTEEIQEARQAVLDIQQQQAEARDRLRAATAGFEFQNIGAQGTTGASQALIGQQIGRAQTLSSRELAALGEAGQARSAYLDTLLSDAGTKYQIAQEERAQLQSLIRETGGEAGITYTDSYEDALKKATEYQKEQEEKERERLAEEQEKAEKKAYKDSLKEQLRALGKSTKGLSKNELERKLEKAIKDDREYEKMIKSLKSSSEKTGETTIKSSYTKTEQGRMIEEALAGGENWNDIKETFIQLGIPVDEGTYMDDYLKRKFGYE